MSERNDVKGTIEYIVNNNPKEWISSRQIENITGFWRQSINCAIRSLKDEDKINVKKVKEKSYKMYYIKKNTNGGYDETN